jgi:hypothetical protein
MNQSNRGFLTFAAACALTFMALAPAAVLAQDTPKDSPAASSVKTDQWIHVRVENKDDKAETVRVNVPVEMAVKVLPAINHENLRNGRVHIDSAHLEDVDLRTMLEAVRSSRDGEYVTVQGRDENVRVAKSAGYLYIHVTENPSHHKATAKDSKEAAKSSSESRVEIKVPMKVVDALFSAGKDELDIVAALRALSSNGDTELVSVKDSENTVRIWIDSKNVAD